MRRGLLNSLGLSLLFGAVLSPCELGAEAASQIGTDDAPLSVGAWSDVSDGLRGRLVIESAREVVALWQKRMDAYKKAGGRTLPDPYSADEVLVYIDIEEAPSDQGPMDICYSRDYIPWRLSDADGTGAAEIPMTIMAPFDLPGWITVPWRSTLHLFVGEGNYRSWQGDFRFGIRYHAWEVSPAKSVRYYLSATLDNLEPAIPGTERKIHWKGKLVLPPVELPTRVQ
jgi:hypothetical protein